MVPLEHEVAKLGYGPIGIRSRITGSLIFFLSDLPRGYIVSPSDKPNRPSQTTKSNGHCILWFEFGQFALIEVSLRRLVRGVYYCDICCAGKRSIRSVCVASCSTIAERLVVMRKGDTANRRHLTFGISSHSYVCGNGEILRCAHFFVKVSQHLLFAVFWCVEFIRLILWLESSKRFESIHVAKSVLDCLRGRGILTHSHINSRMLTHQLTTLATVQTLNGALTCGVVSQPNEWGNRARWVLE